jgi:hypothetical protein
LLLILGGAEFPEVEDPPEDLLEDAVVGIYLLT